MVRVTRFLSIVCVLSASACAQKFSSEAVSSDAGHRGPSRGTDGSTHPAEAAVPAPNIPTDGLLLWMRADKGITQQSGNISRWDDQSPAKMHATQDLSGQQPLFLGDGFNGQPAVLFDGDDDSLQLGSGFSDFSQGLSMFGVFERGDADICIAMFEASNGSEIDDISFGQDNGKLNYEVLENTDTEVTYPTNVPVEFSIVHHADESLDIRRNGLFGSHQSFALPATIERQAVYVGKTLYNGCPSFSGKIGEILVYGRELATDQVQSIEKYLQGKYGCCTQ